MIRQSIKHIPGVITVLFLCELTESQTQFCKETECSSLNVIGPYKLIGSDTTMRCGFVGMGMALLEEVSHCESGL